MSVLEEARDRYLASFEAHAAQLAAGEADWLGALRRGALDEFAAQGLPDTRLEEWRYTNVAPLAKVPFQPATDGAPLARDELERRAGPLFACRDFTFVDGRFEPQLSAPRALGAGIVESLARLRREAPERIEPHLGQVAELKGHPFAALNSAFLDDGALLLVEEEADLIAPLHLIFAVRAETAPRLHHPRVLVVASAGSRAVLIQDHVSFGSAPTFTNSVTELCVERGASVDLVLIQREGAGAFHVSNLAVRQERDSRVQIHTLSLGGCLVRNDLSVLLADEGAECVLNGLFVGRGERLVDNHTLVDHAMPSCTSRELYKGILGERSRGIFRGRVLVRPNAQHTDAQQSNPNLLLGNSAEIDTKPQLEIHANDVRCRHGSAIGQVDADALFYLRSRGLAEAEARDLLTRGFASEILAGLPVPALAEGLDETLLAELGAARGAEQIR